MKPILLNSHLLSHQKVQRTKLKRHFTFLFVCHHLKCFLKTLKFCWDVFSSSLKAQMRLFFCFNCWWTERSTEACKIKPLGSCELCKDSTKRPEYHKADIIKSSLMIPWIWFVCPVSHFKKKTTSKFHEPVNRASVEVWAHLDLCQSHPSLNPITPARMLCIAKKKKTNCRAFTERKLSYWLMKKWGHIRKRTLCFSFQPKRKKKRCLRLLNHIIIQAVTEMYPISSVWPQASKTSC